MRKTQLFGLETTRAFTRKFAPSITHGCFASAPSVGEIQGPRASFRAPYMRTQIQIDADQYELPKLSSMWICVKLPTLPKFHAIKVCAAKFENTNLAQKYMYICMHQYWRRTHSAVL